MIDRIVLSSGALALVLAACSGEPTDTASPPPDTSSPTSVDASADPTPGLPSASPTASEAAGAEITVAGGEVTGPDRVEATLGDQVTIVVTSDVADEIHVHGYDLHQDVAAGETVEVVIDAAIPGVFEIELEDTRLLLTKLEVRS